MTVSRSVLAIILSAFFCWGGALAQEFEPTNVFCSHSARGSARCFLVHLFYKLRVRKVPSCKNPLPAQPQAVPWRLAFHDADSSQTEIGIALPNRLPLDRCRFRLSYSCPWLSGGNNTLSLLLLGWSARPGVPHRGGTFLTRQPQEIGQEGWRQAAAYPQRNQCSHSAVRSSRLPRADYSFSSHRNLHPRRPDPVDTSYRDAGIGRPLGDPTKRKAFGPWQAPPST